MVLFNDNGQSQGSSITLSGFQITGEFNVDSSGCPTVLADGKQCTIYVTFAPTVPGSSSGQLTINDDASNAPQTVGLTGKTP